MELVTTVQQVRQQVKAWRKEGLTVGLVPTMGFLHEGHQSLIARAAKENDRVVVSVFVNPIQFGPNEDFAQYPRDLEQDSALCEATGASLLFHPEPEEMYPEHFSTHVDVDGVTENLCGARRPGHFRGVCTVVSKLFHIVAPDRAYFGEKDAQQLAVIRRMVRDLNFDIEIVGCPIVREADGLAKSSRNTYLSPQERRAALVLNRALTAGRTAMERGERRAQAILSIIRDELDEEERANVDYVKMVDSVTMEDVETAQRDVLVAIAVYIGKTRLIDNFTFHVE
ncbi:MAG: pantoate--beta-alanine ligase [Oscillospiraceae bacterium]|nr:pantoate--beta-alanine ligase [Oscillospiraceae bacterium]